ncbi:hypothetical protein QBC40DRAFT_169372 [Triangularia verruculosa]|uniref:Uncharacterized protein n=1 Tax=Triangularia verruculosa TaxID=2587418 RepID=A0AAN6XL97_9PEZI|nr:hypothetical protein QBC40DRAFT_169372 [Triangularia verruculosa]
MESTMDVSQLVAQMQDTLSTIHTTLASLNTTEHDAKLDELEARRDNTIKHLLAAFSAESHVLLQKRQAEREELAERRRVEDEERERRRRQEDEEVAERNKQEDEARDGRLLHETNEVEEETDHLMHEIEEEARRALDEGQKRLMNLEGRRKELNHHIEEQLRVPIIPTPPRRSRRGSNMPPVGATQSIPTEPASSGSFSNADEKALEPHVISTDHHDGIIEADMVEDHALDTDMSSQRHSSPTSEGRPTSRQDRPLFVQPVISRSGTIIHADQLQQTVPVPVEPIGTPTRSVGSSDASGSPKPDVTWWENKGKEEAESALHHQGTPSPMSFHDDTVVQQASGKHGHGDDGLGTVSTEASAQTTPDVGHQVIEHEEDQCAKDAAAVPQLKSDIDLGSSNDTPRDMSHTGDEMMAATIESANVGSDSTSEYGLPSPDHHKAAPIEGEQVPPPQNLDVPRHSLAPEDIPLSMTTTSETFDSTGDTSFESAHEHTKSNSGEHVSFVGDEEHAALHDTSFGSTEASKTPEHQDSGLSAKGEDVSPASSFHGDDDDDVGQVIPLERVLSHQPPRGSFDEEMEVDQFNETEPEQHEQRGLDADIQGHGEEDHSHTPSLQTIPEHKILEDVTEDAAAPELEQQGVVGLGIQNDAHVDVPAAEDDTHHGSVTNHDEDVPALSSSSDHGDQHHSHYDDDSHLDDVYAQPEPVTPNPLLLQPFRTGDDGNPGSPLRGGDISELPYGVGRHGEGDVEPSISGGGRQLGYHADLGLLPEHGHVGEGRAEAPQEETQESLVPDADNVGDTPSLSAGLETEEDSADQLRRASQASNESVEMEARYTTTVNGESDLFDDEGAESEDVSDIEDAYLNEEAAVDSVVAAMGPEPENEVIDKGESRGDEEHIAEQTLPEISGGGEVDVEGEADVEGGSQAGTLVDVPPQPTVQLPEQMATETEDKAQAQTQFETPYATPLEMPVVPASVPETSEVDHLGSNPNWVHEADNYFDQDDEPHHGVATPRHHSFEQSKDSVDAVESDSRPPSSANQGLSASRHNPDRPQTPEHYTEPSPQENPQPVGHGQGEQHPSPQSVRSQSTIDSAPPSPEQHIVTDTHDPVIRGLVSTQSPSYQTGRPRNDSHLTEYGHHRDESEDTPFAKWQQRDSTLSIPDHSTVAPLNTNRSSNRSRAGSETGEKGGSLFQRMRNVFEQQSHASDINTSRSSYSHPITSASSSHSTNDRHSGGVSGLWGSGGPLSGRFGKSWSSSSNDHHDHRDYHHSPYTGAGYSPDPNVVDGKSGLLDGTEDLN